jgi:hypothetical protein
MKTNNMKKKNVKPEVKIGGVVRPKGKTKLWDAKVIKKGIKMDGQEFWMIELCYEYSSLKGKQLCYNATCLKKI